MTRRGWFKLIAGAVTGAAAAKVGAPKAISKAAPPPIIAGIPVWTAMPRNPITFTNFRMSEGCDLQLKASGKI